MANILSIGIDDASLEARRAALEGAKHTIINASDMKQVAAACSGIRFDIVIIGQSLPAKEKMRVRELLHHYCEEAKILELHSGDQGELEGAHARLRVDGLVPDGLAQAVEGLVAKEQSAETG